MELKHLGNAMLLLCLLGALCNNTQAAPIRITLDTLKNCTQGTVAGLTTDCCPAPDIDLNVPVVDFIPNRDRVPGHRVRKALQCLSGEELEAYTQKLTKGYQLMRALPASDPRSLVQQLRIHCAYGSGAFSQDGLNATNGYTIDIHSNWHFLPWHRAFVYFHERILQKLIDDSTFSLHFWNFDNTLDGTKLNGVEGNGQGCFKPGHFFPDVYNDASTSTFVPGPDRHPRTRVPNATVDLTIIAGMPQSNITVKFPAESIPGNRKAMYEAMQRGSTSRDFFGIPIKYGTQRNFALSGGGSLEARPHNSWHRWVGGLQRIPSTATADPIFYVAHGNAERLWDVWMGIGDNRKLQPTDPDWLDTEFLFWDENQVLRRIKIRDLLSLSDLGYSYEKVYDESWMSWPDYSTIATVSASLSICVHHHRPSAEQ
ncbi:hypothetical protein R1sor_011950 [Riccia sorocarpa]|uniref:Tyrosinase copper-binding domain-containing protein n=1 Tax=Riccia sorocarpa TaxID=122646 RepID=A0ABD3I5S8_9MARC